MVWFNTIAWGAIPSDRFANASSPENMIPFVTYTIPFVTNTIPLVTNTISLVTSTIPLVTNTIPLATSTIPLVTNTIPLVTNLNFLSTDHEALVTTLYTKVTYDKDCIKKTPLFSTPCPPPVQTLIRAVNQGSQAKPSLPVGCWGGGDQRTSALRHSLQNILDNLNPCDRLPTKQAHDRNIQRDVGITRPMLSFLHERRQRRRRGN
jgi:hypothetical protein